MTAEERLVAHYRKRALVAAAERITEADLFDAHGLHLVDALEVLRGLPRRLCPCGGHGRQEAA
jgi:hypothetical protein